MHSGTAPTIRDVAARAGVSVTTVSRVLNHKGDVANATAGRVRAVIEELGYESSLAARSLRSRRKQVIGLVVPDMEHTYGVEIIRAAGHAIVDTDFDLIAMTTGTTDLAKRSRWQQQQIARVNGAVADGVVVAVPGVAEFRTDFPIVTVDPYYGATRHATVVADNYGGARAAVEYLISLGHRRIGHIAGYDFLESSHQRLLGYQDALADAGADCDHPLIYRGDFSRMSGVAALEYFMALEVPPTAIFAANDDCALGVLAEARARGVRVPEMLSVIGFDNVPESAVTHPALTTVDQGIGEAIRTAFSMLVDLINGKPLASQRVVIPVRFLKRDSCAPPPSKN